MENFFDVRPSYKCILFHLHRPLITNYPLQDVQKYMLGKEWLAKVDSETSTPYLLVGSVAFIVKILTQV